MFGIIADLLTIITSLLFPIFASYKALTQPTPSSLIPWLQYFIVLTLLHTLESLLPILFYIPFYSWLRLFGHLYLVAPGKQGATFVYTTYVHPFLREHENDIDEFIGSAHEKAKKAGLMYLKQAIEWCRVNVMGLPPSRPETPPESRSASYAQNLLARFNLPDAGRRYGFVAPAGEWFNVLGNALQGVGASGKSREAQVEDLAASVGGLIPGELKSDEERLSYVQQQRDSLRVLLQAFEREASSLGGASGAPSTPGEAPWRADTPKSVMSDTNLSKSRSELDFDKIGRDEFSDGEEGPDKGKATEAYAQGGGWMPWSWAKGKAAPTEADKKEQ